MGVIEVLKFLRKKYGLYKKYRQNGYVSFDGKLECHFELISESAQLTFSKRKTFRIKISNMEFFKQKIIIENLLDYHNAGR